MRVLKVIGSLKITVVLLLVLFVLVLAGTLYQVEHGIFRAQRDFFDAFFVTVLPIPLPGAQTVFWVIGVNLVASLVVNIARRRMSVGLVISHLGLVMMLVAGFNGIYGTESSALALWEGEAASEVSVPGEWEFRYRLEEDGRILTEGRIPGDSIVEGRRVAGDALGPHGIGLKVVQSAVNTRPIVDASGQRNLEVLSPEIEPQENNPGLLLDLTDGDGSRIPVLLYSLDLGPTVLASGPRVIELQFGAVSRKIPFSVELVDFRVSFYPGTDLAQSFESTVRVSDGDLVWDRVISMNNPLRYRGYTFYQSSYQINDDGREASVFAVRKGGIAEIPYLATAAILAGMVMHYIGRHIRRPSGRSRARQLRKPSTAASRSTVVGVALIAVSVLATAAPAIGAQEPNRTQNVPAPDPSAAARAVLDHLRPVVNDFRVLRVQANGRTMPVETYARHALRSISGRVSISGLDAVEWLFLSLTRPALADQLPTVLVEHPDVFSAVGDSLDDRGRYAPSRLLRYFAAFGSAAEAAESAGADGPLFADLRRVLRSLEYLNDLRYGAAGFSIVPPAAPRDRRIWVGPQHSSAPEEYAEGLRELREAVIVADRSRASDALGVIVSLQSLAVDESADAGRPVLEAWYKRSGLPLWIGATLAAAFLVSVMLRGRPRRYGLVVAVAVPTAAYSLLIAVRVVLTGRPPVVDLYSSALFVGWASALTAFVLVARGVRRDLSQVAIVVSGILLFVAEATVGNQDTLGVVQAVLDTNFWLAVHVIVITLGYAANILAGVGAHAYVVLRLIRPFHTDRHARLFRGLYALLAAGLVLSFAGTMLGGFWADQAWGRFWGWDPKENGALLIILFDAILLHARPANLLKGYGFALVAVLSIPVVLFSWLGVNLLGVGLHSYGFQDGSFVGLFTVLIFEGLFVSLGALLIRAVPEGVLPGVRPMKLVDRLDEGHGAFSLWLQARDKADPLVQARPGSYLTLFVPDNGRRVGRVYSVSGFRREDASIRLTVRWVEGGAGSRFLIRDARLGSSVDVLGPSGSFALADRSEKGVRVFAGAGVGIGVLIAMIKEQLARGPRGTLLLIAVAPSRTEVVYHEEIEADLRGSVAVHYHETAVDGRKIDLNSVVDASEVAATYVCGPPGFVEDFVATVERSGIGSDRVYAEAFHPSPHALVETDGKQRLSILGTGDHVEVRPGQSILDAGLRGGLDLPYGCGVGYCRDCRMKIVSGSVAHGEPNALTDHERASHDSVLTCVAVPLGPVTLKPLPELNEARSVSGEA